jgi:hypothetical protein
MGINIARAFALTVAAVLCAAVVPNGGSLAATLKTLYSFCPQGQVGCPDGSKPLASLVMDPAGNLYGTTQTGGISGASCGQGAGCGTVFELMPNPDRTKWTEKVLYSFCDQAGCADGADPVAGLVRDKSGNLFGTAGYGSGVVFELTPSGGDTIWTETVLYPFCEREACADGVYPQTGVILDKAGILYGTTQQGGNMNVGVVFELKPNAGGAGWSETVLHSFCAQTNCSDGSEPLAGLTQDGDGNLYGTTVMVVALRRIQGLFSSSCGAREPLGRKRYCMVFVRIRIA